MSELDQILDAYGKRRERPDDKSLLSVAVKVAPQVREEFYAAATELGMARRDLAAALFMHGMDRLRRQVKPTRNRSADGEPQTGGDPSAKAETSVSRAAPHGGASPTATQ